MFLQAGCPSCRPTNSVKALKDDIQYVQSDSKKLINRYATRKVTGQEVQGSRPSATARVTGEIFKKATRKILNRGWSLEQQVHYPFHCLNVWVMAKISGMDPLDINCWPRSLHHTENDKIQKVTRAKILILCLNLGSCYWYIVTITGISKMM